MRNRTSGATAVELVPLDPFEQKISIPRTPHELWNEDIRSMTAIEAQKHLVFVIDDHAATAEAFGLILRSVGFDAAAFGSPW